MQTAIESTPLRVRANEVDFSCLEWNGGSRGLVLAAHGFPDHAPTFKALGQALAAEGYRVVAPYLRGYAPTDITTGPYHPTAIAKDLFELATTLRREQEPLYMVGHDWGAAATYLAAAALGPTVSRIVTLAVPHGSGFAQALVANPEQQRRSWYMFFFQLPFASAAVAHQDFAFIERLWRDWSPGYQAPPAEMQALKETLGKEGVLTAALYYYRDTFQTPVLNDELVEFSHRAAAKIKAPCLYLHGTDDGCIGWEVAEAMADGFEGELVKEQIAGVGHFLHLEQPESINARVVDWLAQSGVPSQ